MTPTLLLLAATPAPDGAPAPPPDAAVSDAGELQGEWEVVRVFFGGVDETPLFKDDRWRFTATSAVRLDAVQGQDYPADVRVNPAADTPAIDLTNSREAVHRGIYRRSGDVLLLALDFKGVGHPSAFDSDPGVVVFTLRRARK
jgi:uncharacterized protein (TIGR03067 family)